MHGLGHCKDVCSWSTSDSNPTQLVRGKISHSKHGFSRGSVWDIHARAHTKLAMLGSNSLNTKDLCGEKEEYSYQKPNGILLKCEIVMFKELANC